MNENLPIGWVQSPLIDLLSDLITGKRPKGGVKDITEGVLSLGGEHISSDGRLKLEKPRYIPHEFAQSIKHALIRVNDILIVKDGATTGKTAFIFEHQLKEVAYISEHLFICRSCKEIHPLYLFYFLRSEIGNKAILADFRGATQGGISREFAHKVIVPCAPLNEQRRIVEKLDRIFDRLRRVRDELSHIKKLIDRYRQSVLTAACSGKLTEDWQVKSTRRVVYLGDVTLSLTYGTSAKSSREGNIPVLRMVNIQNGKLNWNNLVFTSDLEDIEKYMLVEGDVLFNRTNSPELVGKTAVYRGERPAIYAGYLIRIRCNNDLLPDYLNYCLNSPAGKSYCYQVKSDGVSQSNINAKKLAAFTFELPSIKEQKEIVWRVEERFAKIDKLEQEYQKAVKLCDRLEQETLAKAFRGELVPQDPNDEPASVLLERIRAEQQPKNQAKTAKSKKRSGKK